MSNRCLKLVNAFQICLTVVLKDYKSNLYSSRRIYLDKWHYFLESSSNLAWNIHKIDITDVILIVIKGLIVITRKIKLVKFIIHLSF